MRTRHGVRTILAAVIAMGFTAIPLDAQTVETEGRFHVAWEDPPEGLERARMHFFLSEAGRRLTELELPPSILQWMGNPMAFDGQAVRVRGRDRGRVAGAAAARLLEVSAFDPIAAASIEGLEGIEAVTGALPWVTVLCKFSDRTDIEPHPTSWYESLLEGSAAPGLDHYWREVSFENISLSGSQVFGWYTLPEPRSAYMNGSSPDLSKLRNDCAAVADADIYYPAYEGISFQFNVGIGGASWGGRSSLQIDGVTKAYAMTWMAEWADQFTYAHEQGHGLGLPHSSGPYTATYDSDWDVMSGGRNYRHPTFNWLAPHTISYHKDILGWIPASDRYVPADGTTRTIELDRLADATSGSEYLMVEVPLSDGTFYTFESRRFLGYDTYLPDEVVIIHHVDRSRSRPANLVDIDGNGEPDDEGAMWRPGETFEDATIGLAVRIDAQTTRGHRVTVSLGDPGGDPDPLIALSPTTLSYETTEGTNPSDKSFSVTNDGGGTLDYTVSSNRSWLTASRSSGSLATGASQNVDVSVDASGLAVGTSNGTITVGGNGTNAPQTVGVSVTVTEVEPDPLIALSPTTLSYETTEGTNPSDKSFSVTNDGGGTLEYTVSSNRSWLTASRSSGSLATGASQNVDVSVDASGLAVGTSNGTITVGGNGTNAPQTVAVSVTVTEVEPDPLIALAPTTLSYETAEGTNPSDKSFSVTNDGGGTLDYTVSSNRSWLTASRSSGSLATGASQNVDVSVDASGLAVGTSNGTITVGGNGTNAPQTVAVSVTVTEVEPDPLIALAPTTLSYETAEGTNPSDKSFSVTNDGGGTLDYTVSSNRSWLTASRSSGSLATGASQNVDVSVDASGLAVGTSNGTITVGGNGTNAPQTVGVSVTVTAPPTGPVIVLDPGSLAFQVKGKKDPPSQQFEIRNEGTDVLAWTATKAESWLSLGTTSGDLPAGTSEMVTVEVSKIGLASGTYTDQITVSGNADNAPQVVAVELKITKGGIVKLKRGRKTFAGFVDEPPVEKYVTLENDGDADATWTAVADQVWLELGAASGSITAGASVMIPLTVDISNLPAGMHSAQVVFEGGDDELPDTLRVELMVSDGPGVSHVPEQAASHLLGAVNVLSAAELDYLDYAGNGNGQFDVGDLRAWLIQSGELRADALFDLQPVVAPAPESTDEGAQELSRESAERRD